MIKSQIESLKAAPAPQKRNPVPENRFSNDVSMEVDAKASLRDINSRLNEYQQALKVAKQQNRSAEAISECEEGINHLHDCVEMTKNGIVITMDDFPDSGIEA